MGNIFYTKLALQNIKKNSKTYIPFLITCVFSVAMFYNITALSVNPRLGSATLNLVMMLGTIVVGIFSLIFLYYTNSFLMKRRQKEFGLFNLLGMEKQHLRRLILIETLFTAAASIIIGLLLGILSNKLMFLILLKILRFEVQMGFEISFLSISTTAALFCIIFILILLSNVFKVSYANPIELLRGSQTGEREPKTRWLLTLIGVLTLGAGYTIALTVEKPLDAILLFFVAVLLVIIGTYCLFTAGSIVLLKALRKNKGYYYKTKNFISVSGMIHRMKQNAVGLGNICILSAAVLLMLSSTVSLYIGLEDVIRNTFSRDIIIRYRDTDTATHEKIRNEVQTVIDKNNLHAQDRLDYLVYQVVGNLPENTIPNPYLLTLEQYNKISANTETLNNGEIILCSVGDEASFDHINLYGSEFTVKSTDDASELFFTERSDAEWMYYVVVSDIDVIYKLANNSNLFSAWNFAFNLGADENTSIAVYDDINAKLSSISLDENRLRVNSLESQRKAFFELAGGLLFLGIFLGTMFIMAAVLVIYYKQVSEGYVDKDRFLIMQKVGLDHKEIRSIVRNQVLMVFFLPLLTAIIHIIVAFPMITRLLAVLNLTNIMLFARCTAITMILFTVLYSIVYILTAREYYRIVR